MTADIRTAAQREAEKRWPDSFVGQIAAKHDFVAGAVWGAARVTPTLEQAAEAIHNSLPDSMNGNCYQTPRRCYERGGPCVDLADTVRALMAGLAEGESSEQ